MPLLSAILSLFFIFTNKQKYAEVISSAAVSISAILSIYAYIHLETYMGIYQIYNWLQLENIKINFAIVTFIG